MKKKLALICAGLALTVAMAPGCSKKAGGPGAPAKESAPAAFTYKAPDGGFSIDLPEKFKDVKIESQPVQGSDSEMKTYMAGSEQDGVMYMVAVVPVAAAPPAEAVAKALELSMKGMAGPTGTILKQANITIAGSPGITARVKKAQGESVLFMDWAETFIDKTMFQISIIAGDEKKLDSADAQKFIKSFKITAAK